MAKKQAVVTEKLVKDKIKVIIGLYEKYNSMYSFCPMTFGYGESGHPDRLLLVNGKLIGIEVKKDQNNHHCRPELKPKANEVMQQRQAGKINSAGGLWICIHNYNLHELQEYIDTYAVVKSKEFNDKDKEKLEKVLG